MTDSVGDEDASTTADEAEREDRSEGDTDGDLESENYGALLNRRTVLGGAVAGLGLGALGYTFWSRNAPDTGEDTERAGSGDSAGSDEHLPFDVWSEVQDALRTNPDHLPGRAAQLVSAAQLNDQQRTETDRSDEDSSGAASDTGDDTVSSTEASTLETAMFAGEGREESVTQMHLAPSSLDTQPDASDHLEEIFQFVRDEIQTVPTTSEDMDEPERVIRWGPRGTLRCGTGTPRDKTELLAKLYRDAGYETALQEVEMDTEAGGLSPENIRADLLQTRNRESGPAIEDETIESWAERLGTDVSGNGPTIVDEDGRESLALADVLRGALPDEPSEAFGGPDEFDYRWDATRRSTNAVPIVEVRDEENSVFHANLFGDVPFGESGSEEDAAEISDRDVQTVKVTLSAALPNTLEDPFELVSGVWEVPELIGRQLLVRTPAVTGPMDQPTIGIDDMDTFIPSLTLQGMDLSGAEQAEHSEFGPMVTLTGNQFETEFDIEDGSLVRESETITRDGETFYDPDMEPDPSEIDRFSVEADSSNYPRIRLDATALDSNGEHVSGLPGTAFAGFDETEDIFPTLVENSPVPQILFLRDVSGSMQWGVSAATDDESYDELEALIRETEPAAKIERRDVDSALWTHLPEAVADNPDLIIYAHDGQPANEYDSRVDAILSDAPKTVLLNAFDVSDGSAVATSGREVFDRQATLSGAQVVSMGQWDAVRSALVDAVANLSLPTYRFDYHVPDTESGQREVELLVGQEPTATAHTRATSTYETRQGGITRTIAGLYLTVEHEGKEVTRTLGGWDPLHDDSWDPYGGEPDPEAGVGMPGLSEFAADARMALFGGVDISFEGDSVPFPVALDDVIEGKQSYRTLDTTLDSLGIEAGEPIDEQQFEQIQEVWNTGRMSAEWNPLLVQAPLPERGDGLTYFLGPRMVAYQVKPVIDGRTVAIEESLDIFPHVNAATVHDDPDVRFFRTLERTARLAILEDVHFDTTTLSLIGETPVVQTDELSDFDVKRDPYTDLRNHAGLSHRSYQLAPTDGSERAMWNVNRETGMLLGILPDGTGGARRRRQLYTMASDERAMAAIELFMDVVDEANLLSKTGSASMGVVGIYFAQLAKLYAQVTAVVGASSTGAITNTPSLSSLATGTAAGVVEDQVSGSDWVGRVDALATILNI